MKINVTYNLSAEMIENIVLYYIYNRSNDFEITKKSILEGAKNFLEVRGLNGIPDELIKFKNQKDFQEKKELARVIARRFFPNYFFAKDGSAVITYLDSL